MAAGISTKLLGVPGRSGIGERRLSGARNSEGRLATLQWRHTRRFRTVLLKSFWDERLRWDIIYVHVSVYSVVIRVKDSGHDLGTRRTKKRHSRQDSRTGARPLNLSHDPFEPSSTFMSQPQQLSGTSVCVQWGCERIPPRPVGGPW